MAELPLDGWVGPGQISGMILSQATAADAPALVALVNGAYRGERAQAGWANEAGLLDGQRTDLATLQGVFDAGHATILQARDPADDALLGCVSIEPTETASIWYLGMLTIDPNRQAAGLGRRLLEAGEAFAVERGAKRIRMTVIQLRHSLIAWYERRGYRLTGATEPFPYADERFGIPLRDDLHFVVLERVVG